MSSDHRAELEAKYKGFVNSFPKVGIVHGVRAETPLGDPVLLLISLLPQNFLRLWCIGS